MTNLIKKIVTGIMATLVAISTMGAVPAFAFAKEGHGNGKNNHGQEVSAIAKAKHHDDDDNDNDNDEDHANFGLGLGLGKLINIDATGTVSGAPFKIFRQEVKEAKKDQKAAKKEAKTEFKADIKTATTPEQKNVVVKTYLTSVLNAFKAFAAAKEAAFVKLIASIGGTTTPVNHAPVANNQSVTLNEDSNVAITLTGSDSDSNPLTYSIVTSPAHGILTGTAPNVNYLPNVNYNGTDSFTFKVNDGSLNSANATVSITVNGVNDTPIANAQSVSVAKNTSLPITLTGTDPEGHALTYIILTSTTHGTLSGTAPSLSYLPSTDYTGTDSFTFKVNDGTIDSAVVTVTITVNP